MGEILEWGPKACRLGKVEKQSQHNSSDVTSIADQDKAAIVVLQVVKANPSPRKDLNYG